MKEEHDAFFHFTATPSNPRRRRLLIQLSSPLLLLQALPLPLQPLPKSLTHHPLTLDFSPPTLRPIRTFQEPPQPPRPWYTKCDRSDEGVGGRGDEAAEGHCEAEGGDVDEVGV